MSPEQLIAGATTMTTITSTPSMPILPINVSLRNNHDAARMHQDNYRLGHQFHHHHHHQFPGVLLPPKDDHQRTSPSFLAATNDVRFENHLLGEPPAKTVLAYPSDLLERLNVVSTMHKATDDYSDTRSSSVSSFQADSVNQLDANDDHLSCCSEDSELSVGKEEEGAVRTTPPSIFHLGAMKHAAIRRMPSSHDDDMDTAEDSCSRTPTAHISNGSVDDVSNESLPKTPTTTAQLRFPVVRPSPTRLQEEFLRNSQLYAEELMKHQMSFLAATKGLHLSAAANKTLEGGTSDAFRPSHALNPNEAKAGFRPLVRPAAAPEKDIRWTLSDDIASSVTAPAESTHFRGIHSHLNAISKITSALGRDLTALKSPIGSMNSRESSQSPPDHFNQLINQNMLNDSNLKFSIDNILKPGFGRRITDPLLKRSKPSKKTVNQKAAQQQRNLHKLQLATEKHGTPIDLTAMAAGPPLGATTPSASPSFSATSPDIASDTNALPATAASCSSTLSTATASSLLSPGGSSDQDKVSSTSNSTTASSASSSSPMVWPAWVYCTRYSDRPSSGTFNFIIRTSHISHTTIHPKRAECVRACFSHL